MQIQISITTSSTLFRIISRCKIRCNPCAWAAWERISGVKNGRRLAKNKSFTLNLGSRFACKTSKNRASQSVKNLKKSGKKSFQGGREPLNSRDSCRNRNLSCHKMSIITQSRTKSNRIELEVEEHLGRMSGISNFSNCKIMTMRKKTWIMICCETWTKNTCNMRESSRKSSRCSNE